MKMHYSYVLIFLLLGNSIRGGEAFVAGIYGLGIAFGCAEALSLNTRHEIYGDRTVPTHVEGAVHSIASHFDMQQPVAIKEADSFFDVFSVFSNNDTLFLSKKVVNDLSQMSQDKIAIFNNLDVKSKKELLASLLMIGNQYDKKVLALSVVTPLAIWGLAWLAHYGAKKVDSSAKKNQAVQSICDFSEKLYNSFKAKALTSLLMLGAYIVYQRHCFNTQALALLK